MHDAIDAERIVRAFAEREWAYAGKLTPGQWSYFVAEFAGAEGEPGYFAIAKRDGPEWVLAFFTAPPDWIGETPPTPGREVAEAVRAMIDSGVVRPDGPFYFWVSRGWQTVPA